MKARSMIMHCFREYFYIRGYNEVTPPTIVQTQVRLIDAGKGDSHAISL